MNLNSRLRQLERIIEKKPTPEPEPMGKRLLRATPTWQLEVIVASPIL